MPDGPGFREVLLVPAFFRRIGSGEAGFRRLAGDWSGKRSACLKMKMVSC